jgi:hypothetical protein
MSNVHIIGEGILGWGREERVSDRYGAISLFGADESELRLDVKSIAGKKGKLRAVVLETRQSRHIGDFFHGFRPVTPELDEVIELGIGTAFFEADETGGGDRVGVEPEESRDYFWMNPQRLYRANDQTVRLEFVQGDMEMEPWIEENEEEE